MATFFFGAAHAAALRAAACSRIVPTPTLPSPIPLDDCGAIAPQLCVHIEYDALTQLQWMAAAAVAQIDNAD